MHNVKLVLTIFVFAFLSQTSACSHRRNFSKDLESPLGMNAHLLFDCSNMYIEELCMAMSNCGVQVVRLDVYWHKGNMLVQNDLLEKAIYYIDKYGMETELNMPQCAKDLNSKELQSWVKTIQYYAQKYDGHHLVSVGNTEKPRKIKIRYFEVMNELDRKFDSDNESVAKAFSLIKLSSNAIREIRPDGSALLVMPGMSQINDFNRKLLAYKDCENISIKDIVDIMSFHLYSSRTNDFVRSLMDWMSFFNTFEGLADKPVWLTEFGNSTWDYSIALQAENLPKQALLASAMGVDKFFYYQFHQPGGNELKTHHQREDYFGIIETSIQNSYGSFLCNDGIYDKAITPGDATKKVYIRMNDSIFALRTISKGMQEVIKKTGIAVGGNNYTIQKVSIEKKNKGNRVIYQGRFKIGTSGKDVMTIPPHCFGDLEVSDIIVVYVKDVKNQSEKWNCLQSLPAYESYSKLAKMIGVNPTRPTYTINNGQYNFVWMNEKKRVNASWMEREGKRTLVRYKVKGTK